MATLITTNHHTRELISMRDALDSGAMTTDEGEMFDYIQEGEGEDEVSRFARYQGEWVDVMDVQPIYRASTRGYSAGSVMVDDDSPLAAWHGLISDSMATGTVVRLVDDGEAVIFGSVLITDDPAPEAAPSREATPGHIDGSGMVLCVNCGERLVSNLDGVAGRWGHGRTEDTTCRIAR